jgi:hypothetical protein
MLTVKPKQKRGFLLPGFIVQDAISYNLLSLSESVSLPD